MKKNDSLGDRMKNNYEYRTRYFLPRRTYTIIRLDGKAFHTFTRHCVKPYDSTLRDAMTDTAKYLCEHIQGANLAYTQSDEISILLTDFSKKETAAWFDNNLQKMCSVSASMATAYFHSVYKAPTETLAFFDSRVFQIPDEIEVGNYFVWRQQDAERNSIQMLAQSKFSHKQLHGKSCPDIHEMLHGINMNWNDEDPRNKRGTLIGYEPAVGWTYYLDTPIFQQQRDGFDLLIQKRGY